MSGFDLNSLGAALPHIPEDNTGRELLLKLAEAEGKKAEAEGKKAEAEGKKAEGKKAEAEAEGKKAEAEGRKAEADLRKAEIELKVLELKLPAKKTFKAVIKRDALGLKTKLAEKMKEFNVAGAIARLLRPDGSSEYDTELIFEGSKCNVEKMKDFLLGEFETTSVKVQFEDLNDIRISQTPSGFHRGGSSGGRRPFSRLTPTKLPRRNRSRRKLVGTAGCSRTSPPHS